MPQTPFLGLLIKELNSLAIKKITLLLIFIFLLSSSSVLSADCQSFEPLFLPPKSYYKAIFDKRRYISVTTEAKIEPLKNKRYLLSIILEAELDFLREDHYRLARSNYPTSSCDQRYYDNNDYAQIILPDGKIQFSSSIKFEQWVCKTIKYPCHDKWIDFDTCYKELKTRLYKHVVHLDTYIAPYLTKDKENNYTIVFRINGSYNDRVSYDIGIIKLPSFLVKHDIKFVNDENGKIRLRANIKSGKLRENTACSHYKRLVDAGFMRKKELIAKALEEEKQARSLSNKINERINTLLLKKEGGAITDDEFKQKVKELKIERLFMLYNTKEITDEELKKGLMKLVPSTFN